MPSGKGVETYSATGTYAGKLSCVCVYVCMCMCTNDGVVYIHIYFITYIHTYIHTGEMSNDLRHGMGVIQIG